MKTCYVMLLTVLVMTAPFASATVVNFDGATNTDLPYTENGLTFTSTGDIMPSVFGGSDGSLVAGTNTGFSIRILASSSQPIDLESIALEHLTRTWTIESSSGATFSPAGPGIVDFTSLTGWAGINSFELIHDPGEANGSIRLDDITFTVVPEPTSAVLLIAGCSAVTLMRRRQLTTGCS